MGFRVKRQLGPRSPKNSGDCRSMPEMAHVGHDHGEAFVIGCGDYLVIAHGAAGLDNGRSAGLGGGQKAVSKREKGVRRDHGTLRQRGLLASRFGSFR